MHSISLKNQNLITSFEYVSIDSIFPHEKVIINRKNALKKYILSCDEYSILPSIICCNKSKMIIDGHHRFNTLKELGYKMIPVTFIDYMDNSIRTHNEKGKQLSKNILIERAIKNNLFEPKSTIHEIITINKIWKPLVLLSTLSQINL